MEAREILVANTKTQQRMKITTSATTLGELKVALDGEGVDYTGMTFTEGITKTQLLDDTTPLPRDVMYKGNVTNSLVILLTNTKKKIESGAGDRDEAYKAVKEMGLQDEVLRHFGCNFTNVSTTNLWEFIDSWQDEDDDDDDEDEECKCGYELTDMEYHAYLLIRAMAKAGSITPQGLKAMASMLTKSSYMVGAGAGPAKEDTTVGGIEVSRGDVDEMLSSIGQ